MEDRAAPYVLAAGETRRDDAIRPFKALASDTGGLLSVCEFTRHRHSIRPSSDSRDVPSKLVRTACRQRRHSPSARPTRSFHRLRLTLARRR